jgi:hypothetical protein
MTVESMAFGREEGPISSPEIEGTGPGPDDEDVPDIPRPVQPRVQPILEAGLAVARGLEEAETHGFGVPRKNREIDAPCLDAGPEGHGASGLDR